MALVQAENVGNQFTGLGGLPIFRQLGLLIGLAASVAVGMAIVMWSQTPSYRLLYSDISSQDSAQVASALQSGGFEYKIDDASGRVWVAGDSMHEARMMLASQGLPEGGNVGCRSRQEKGDGCSRAEPGPDQCSGHRGGPRSTHIDRGSSQGCEQNSGSRGQGAKPRGE